MKNHHVLIHLVDAYVALKKGRIDTAVFHAHSARSIAESVELADRLEVILDALKDVQNAYAGAIMSIDDTLAFVRSER